MSEEPIEREAMEYDVVIVGAGPAGLSAAIRLKQRAQAEGADISVAVLEKGSEVGAHILSGAVIDPRGMTELFPDWKERGAPLSTPVTKDVFKVLGPEGALSLPNWPMPSLMKNHGNYIASLGEVCRWLAEQAEALEVEIYPGFAASELVFDENDAVAGVVAGVFGVGRDGERKDDFQPGMELRAKYVLLGEGVRGSLSKQVIAKYELDKGKSPQKYGIGLKELWKVPDDKFRPGFVQHTFGWPLDNKTGGGSFMYHFGDNYVSVGFVVHLNYPNPYLSPYDEFQRFKTHVDMREFFEGGERVAYGARAITEGGWQSLPDLSFPGGALLGCAAGMVNVPRIKGSHNAMKSGMQAADAAFDALQAGRASDVLEGYQSAVERGWIADDLKPVRNVKPLWSKYGAALGVVLGGLDMWINQITGGWSPFGTLDHGKTDAESTEPARKHEPIVYPKPDGRLTFDKLTNLSYSATNHEEDQPIHLRLGDPELQLNSEFADYAGLSNRYCPAGVYEWVEDSGQPKFVINAQNCVHCKTCDIKDPNQNITWTTPEGAGGPNYPNM